MGDKEVLEQMKIYTRNERRLQALWLRELSEIDQRRLYALEGFDSLSEYVRQGLRYSEGSAGKRIYVARTAQQFPWIYELISANELSLSSVARLSAHLTKENHRAVLNAARGKCVREVEEQVAALKPKPDVPASMRLVAGTGNTQAEFSAEPAPDAKPRKKEKLAPLSAARYHVNFTVSKEMADLQRRLKALTRHLAKEVSMEDVFQAGLEVLLKKYEPSQKLATSRKTTPAPRKASTPSFYVSRDMQRKVFCRDGYRCVYVAPDGRRCAATTQLQIDHFPALALGGSSTDVNKLRTLCSCHNLWTARQTFGDSFIDSKIRARRSSQSPAR